MPLTTFNQAPYFDDFNIEDVNSNNQTVADKNYLRILFQPGFAVQTRELNQLQTILQSQIQRFGDSLYKEGTAVLGDDKPIFTDNVDYIEFIPADDAPSGLADILKLQEEISNNDSTAKILKVESFEEDSINKIRLYLKYEQDSKFIVEEDEADNALFFFDSKYTNALNSTVEFLGNIGTISSVGSGFSYAIRENIYYMNGSFVHFPETSLFLKKPDGADVKGDLRFLIKENQITSADDSTLLDNANGSLNFSAPGADRYQIVITAIFIDKTEGGAIRNLNGGDSSSTAFLETDPNLGTTKRLLTVDVNGVKQETSSLYSNLDARLARRTFEESGHYVLQPFRVTFQEFYKDPNDKKYIDGYYSAEKIEEGPIFGINNEDDAKDCYVAEIDTSTSYVNGYRYDYPKKVLLKGDKARTDSRFEDTQFTIRYGNYVEMNIDEAGDVPHPTISSTDIPDIKSMVKDGDILRIYTRDGKDLGIGLENANPAPLLFRLPYEGVKSLTSFEYEKVKLYENITLSGSKITISSAGTFTEIQSNDETSYGILDANNKILIANEDFNIDVDNTFASTITFNILDSSEFNPPFKVFAPEKVTSGRARSKTKRIGATSLNGLSANEETVITLSHSDVLLNETLDDLKLLRNGVEVSNVKFRIVDNGQRADKYTRPVIGITSPITIGDDASVQYSYFAHGSGEYFCADSYAGFEYGDIPTYNYISLADYVDFRKKEQPDTEDAAAADDQIIPRVNSTANIKDVSVYNSRIDKLIINDTGALQIIKGTPGIDPTTPDTPNNSLTLYEIFVPYYTGDLRDIKNVYIDNSRYTMRKIGDIDQRLQRIEYDRALSDFEKSANAISFLNDDGQSLLFKAAFLADNFAGHGIGDVKAPDYLVAIDRLAREARPYYKQKNFRFFYNFPSASNSNDRSDNVVTNLKDVYDDSNTYTFNQGDSVVDPTSTTRPTAHQISFSDGSPSIVLNLVASTKFADIYDDKTPELNGEDYYKLVIFKPTDKIANVNIRTGNVANAINVTELALDKKHAVLQKYSPHPNGVIRSHFTSKILPIGQNERVLATYYNGNIIYDSQNTSQVLSEQGGTKTATIKRLFSQSGSLINTANKSVAAQNKNNKQVDGASTAEILSLWEGTTTELFSQELMSQTLSIQPFEVSNYNGHLTLSPSSDEWIDTERRPATVINNNGAMDAIDFLIENTDVFEGVLGTEWNAWETNVQSRTTTTTRSGIWRGTNGRGRWPLNQRTTTTTTTTGTRTRTGTNRTLAEETIEQDLGDRVVDLNIIPFIRSRDISFKVTGLKPGTQHYVFFDDEDVTRYCAPTPEFVRFSETTLVDTYNNQGAPDTTDDDFVGPISCPTFNVYASPIVTTLEQGDLTGTFRIPNNSDLKFRTGQRLFKLTSSPNNNDDEADSVAEATYSASGMIQAKEQTIMSTRQPTGILTENLRQSVDFVRTTTRTRVRRWDPIAQTFLIDENQHQNGVFLSDVDVYFAEKPNWNVDVEIYIVPTELGIPTQDVVPGSRVIKSNHLVNVSGREPSNPSADIVPTNFKFENPLHLKAGQEYAMIVFSTSIDYRVWTSVLGQKDIRSETIIDKNPSVGVLLKSQNTRTWTPDQTRDLAFKMNRCVFVSEKSFTFKTRIEGRTQGVENFDFSLININESSVILPNTNITHTLKFKNQNNSVVPNGSLENLRSNSSYPLNGAITNAQNIESTVTLTTEDTSVSPMFDLERYSLISISNTKAGPRSITDSEIEAASKKEGYVTRQIPLLKPATRVRVMMDTLRLVESSDIKVFVNINEESNEDGTRVYKHVPVISAAGVNASQVPISANEEDFITTEFNLNPSELGEDVNTMIVKVVFEASDSSKVCRIQNFAAFGLA